MSFSITRLSVHNFRSYEDFQLEPDEGLTILVGPNATGKTNLVEAVQLVTEADSFRKPTWAEVVRWGSGCASISLHAEEGSRRHDVEMVVTDSGRRSYKIAGKTRRSVADVAGIIPCVVFTPEDLRIVKDSAERRRSALDGIGAQLSRTYGQLKAEYDRVVRQRNALLKQDDLNEDTVAPWDERLVSLGARLSTHRRSLFEKVSAATTEVYAGLADDGPLVARYIPSWERDGVAGPDVEPAVAIEMHLASKRAEERSRGATLAGPHRDEIVFDPAGRDARSFASQGQQRTVALSFKLAEVRVVADVSGARPVLLLDDVMSELDESRRHALTSLVGQTAQTIITTTDLGYFAQDLVDRAKVVSLG